MNNLKILPAHSLENLAKYLDAKDSKNNGFISIHTFATKVNNAAQNIAGTTFKSGQYTGKWSS